MKRIGLFLVVVAAVAAIAIAVLSYASVSEFRKTQALSSVRILEGIEADLRAHAALRAELQQGDGASSQSAYLANIRRDGVPAHAPMRHKIDSLSKSNVAVLTLLDLYEPYAQTEDFKREARAFREYAIAWNDRWDSVMEFFMAGGNLPASDVPFPNGLVAAVEAEKKRAAD